MTIINYDRTAVINYNFVADIHIKERGTPGRHVITVDYGGNTMVRGGALCMAAYKKSEYCRYALEMFFAAVRNGEDVFEFPDGVEIEDRMNVARQSGIMVKTKANRHGGS